MFTCPKCTQCVFKGIRQLIRHLRKIHCLSDGQNIKFVCSQDGCPRTYYNLNSFSKHLHRAHSTSAATVQPTDYREPAYISVEIDSIDDSSEVPVDVGHVSEELKKHF